MKKINLIALAVLLSASFFGLAFAQPKPIPGNINRDYFRRDDGPSIYENGSRGLLNGFFVDAPTVFEELNGEAFDPCSTTDNQKEGASSKSWSGGKGPSCEQLKKICFDAKTKSACQAREKDGCRYATVSFNSGGICSQGSRCIPDEQKCPALFKYGDRCCPIGWVKRIATDASGALEWICVEDPRGTGQGVGICRSPKVNTCRDNACGNAKIDRQFGETCDLGKDRNNKNLNTATSKCPFCRLARCGDGFTQINVEQCDDGNLKDGDGCSAQCRYERKELKECADETQYVCWNIDRKCGTIVNGKDVGTPVKIGDCSDGGIIYKRCDKSVFKGTENLCE